MRQAARYFDRVTLAQVLRLPDWVRPLMLFMTLLGQPPITVGLVAGMIGFGVAKDSHMLIYAGLIALVTVVIASLLKLLLRRPRPDNEYTRHMLIHTYSFPSGHAAGSVVCFGAFAYAVCHYYPTMLIPGILVVGVLSFLIGVSRVYLRAHYPSDVVAGWIIGLVGLLVIMLDQPLW